MSDEIVAGGIVEAPGDEWPRRQLVPMRIGEATLFIEQVGEPEIAPSDEIYTVAPSPTEAFRAALDATGETVRGVGDRLEKLGETMRPAELTVGFSLSFDAKGKAQVIPILVTSEATVHTGIKVTAKWEPGKAQTSETPTG